MNIIVLILGLLVAGLIIYIILNKKGENNADLVSFRAEMIALKDSMNTNLGQNRDNMQTRLDMIRDSVDKRLLGMQDTVDKTGKTMNDRLTDAAKVISGVKQEMGGIAKLPAQIQELQNIFQKTKARGVIGEVVMENLIADTLPRDTYDFQYHFGSEIVDAVIKLEQGIIPIDAKFPLDNFKKILDTNDDQEKKEAARNFKKDVKKKVIDIKNKYIRPADGTVDFAIMYIPSEAIFYEIIVGDDNLEAFMRDYKILALSPNTLFYFLRVVMMGFEGRKVEKNAALILSEIKNLRVEGDKFAEKLGVVDKHLTQAKNKMDETTIDFTRLQGHIGRASQIEVADNLRLGE